MLIFGIFPLGIVFGSLENYPIVYDYTFLKHLSLDHETLVIFDIDQTLVYSDQMIHQPQSKTKRKLYEEGFFAKLTENQQSLLISQVMSSEGLLLIDPNFPQLLSELQQKKIPVIALTARKTGNYGCLISLENQRIEGLKKLKIDFSGPLFPDVILTNLSKEGSTACFKKGILFTHLFPKDLTLEKWLESVHFQPRKIIFIDDQCHYLTQIRNFCQKKHIPFQGYQFKGIEKLDLPLNDHLLDFQFFLLKEEGFWMKDQEAFLLFN